jgi:hypothetical protein
MSSPERPGKPDHVSTRIISHCELTIDGVPVHWWAVVEHPTLVTVRTAAFGSLADFTYKDASEFALTLAKRLLAKHYTRLEGVESKVPSTPPLKMPGWFQGK